MDEPREEASTSAPLAGDELDVQPELTASDSNDANLERGNALYSSDISQLRRRHTPAVTMPDEPAAKGLEEDIKRRPSADHNVGGGFYECNIW